MVVSPEMVVSHVQVVSMKKQKKKNLKRKDIGFRPSYKNCTVEKSFWRKTLEVLRETKTKQV